MKNIFILLTLFVSLMAIDPESAAMELDFNEDYKSALAEAKKENKPLFLLVVNDPCPFCDRLVHNTLADKKVKDDLRNYVKVVVGKYSVLPKQFKTSMVPKVYFINADKEEAFYDVLGYLNTKDFLEETKEANEILAK